MDKRTPLYTVNSILYVEIVINRGSLKTRDWRSGRDSNPRYAFDVYSLSRRAPSTTRPPLRTLPDSCAPKGVKRESGDYPIALEWARLTTDTGAGKRQLYVRRGFSPVALPILPAPFAAAVAQMILSPCFRDISRPCDGQGQTPLRAACPPECRQRGSCSALPRRSVP